MNPTDCPRFNQCSAPLCPLDERWRERRHRNGDRICLYLLEMAKAGSTAATLVLDSEEMRQALGEAYSEISTCCAPIRSEIKRTTKRGSKLGRTPGKKKPAGDAAGQTDREQTTRCGEVYE